MQATGLHQLTGINPISLIIQQLINLYSWPPNRSTTLSSRNASPPIAPDLHPTSHITTSSQCPQESVSPRCVSKTTIAGRSSPSSPISWWKPLSSLRPARTPSSPSITWTVRSYLLLFDLFAIIADNVYYYEVGKQLFITIADMKYNANPVSDIQQKPWKKDMDDIAQLFVDILS